ncbi:MAG: hypothetical protein KBC64_04205 [Simkaniaceae bacterium]|nr:hypothetical protein [Simkaniaceae bacterium]
MVKPVSASDSSFNIDDSNNQALSSESLAACLLIEKAYAATDPGIKEALQILTSNKVVGALAQKCLSEAEQGNPEDALAHATTGKSNDDFTVLQITIGFAADAMVNNIFHPDQMVMSKEQAHMISSVFDHSPKLQGHGLQGLIYNLLEQYLHGQLSMRDVQAVLTKALQNM